MNEEGFELVKNSLSRNRRTVNLVGQVTPTQLEVDELYDERITPETDLPPMQPLFRMFDVPCFYRGELVADCGKAKSGKTYFLSILMAACLTQKALALERIVHTDLTDLTDLKPLRVLWIDTEQSQQSTQEILKERVIPLAEKSHTDDINNTFYAFNLRGLGFEKRGKMVNVAIRTIKPDICIIDGIKDLMTDINDAVQATRIMEQLMALAKEFNCSIVCVLQPLDAHIGATWISKLLKVREPLLEYWQVQHCLFGLHLLMEEGRGKREEGRGKREDGRGKKDEGRGKKDEGRRKRDEGRRKKDEGRRKRDEGRRKREDGRCISIVEREETAVVLSEIFPESIWMAYATTSHLVPDLFAPLEGRRVTIYPRTDPTMSTFLFFEDLVDQTLRLYDLDLHVDATLEDHATEDQKERCIDILDFIKEPFSDPNSATIPPVKYHNSKPPNYGKPIR